MEEKKKRCLERCCTNYAKAYVKFANRKAMSAEAKAKLSALMKACWGEGGKFQGKRKAGVLIGAPVDGVEHVM